MNKPSIIGNVPVDSGSLCIVDPCYLVPGEGHHPLTHEARMQDGNFNFAHSHGTGLIFANFGGDGYYAVKAARDKYGRITRITIDFSR